MSDQPSVSATGKSKEEVAFDILNKLKGAGVWGERNKDAILDMYAECLIATRGERIVEGLNTQAETPAPPLTQPVEAQPQQTQQAQPAQPQPVHAQQQAVQQAFKQG